jgi:hypothetical protein
MKSNILFKSLVAVAVATTFAGCDENDWNNNLDGFEDANNSAVTNVQTIEYTLTDADYAAIASNSTNVALAGTELKSALSAVGTRKAFSEQIKPADYVPAFLSSSSFSYFTLTDGSAVKLTYNVSEGLPTELNDVAAAQTYTLTETDYQGAWDSEDNFISAFAPSHAASKYVPGILAKADLKADNNFCLVTYNEATQEPVFGNVGGSETPAFEPTSVIGTIEADKEYTAKGYVSAVCAQGFILTDNSGSIFVYMGSSFDTTKYPIGTQMEVSGSVTAYRTGLQFSSSTSVTSPVAITTVGTQNVTYPTATVLSASDLDTVGARTENSTAKYVQLTGTVKVSSSGNINITVDGAAAQGSVYGATTDEKAALVDGETVTIKGYLVYPTGSTTKYINIIITHIGSKAYAPKRRANVNKAAAVEVPTSKVNALYKYSSGKWAVASGYTVLSDDDYTAMGQTYKNLTEPAKYLPAYLKTKFPYAQADDVKNVVYTYYNRSKSSLACDQYIYNGSEWVINDGITTETTQFVRNNGSWMYDPNVTITLPGGKNQELSTKYFQACVDWVYNNICVPLGDTSIKSGKFYVSSYGNNEYYSGASAYQGNVDIRASAAKSQYAAEYGDMSDDDVVKLMKTRFMNEVMPGALSTLHPDAKPIDGLEVIYTINFVAYTGASESHTARFKVVGVGKFEPIDCTWDN